MDIKTVLEEAVEFQSGITHALHNIIMASFANEAVADTKVLQRELRRFYFNALASVNFKINSYDTDKNTFL